MIRRMIPKRLVSTDNNCKCIIPVLYYIKTRIFPTIFSKESKDGSKDSKDKKKEEEKKEPKMVKR